MPDQIREGLRILGERRQRERQERHRNAQAQENERLARLIRSVAPDPLATNPPATTSTRPATESGARSGALNPAGLPLDQPNRADRERERTIEVKTEGVKRERMAMPPTPPPRRRNLQQQRDDAEFVPRPVRPVSPSPGLSCLFLSRLTFHFSLLLLFSGARERRSYAWPSSRDLHRSGGPGQRRGGET